MSISQEKMMELAKNILARRKNPQSDRDAFPTLSLEEAYAVQSAIDAILTGERGWTRIGYKAGATNPPARQAMKLDEPFHGRLYREMTEESPKQIDFVPNFTRTIEVEIGVEIGKDLPGDKGPYDAAALKAAVRALIPSFEIVGTVFDMQGENGTARVVADMGGHAAWIRGRPVTDFQNIDVIEGPIRVTVNGEEKAIGKGANVDGNPFHSAAFIANTMAKAGKPLKAGDFIITGTTIKALPAQAGMTIKADFGPLGLIETVLK